MHLVSGPANTGSALNIRVYLCSSAADCFFRDYSGLPGATLRSPCRLP